jgi:hypothetical protein
MRHPSSKISRKLSFSDCDLLSPSKSKPLTLKYKPLSEELYAAT